MPNPSPYPNLQVWPSSGLTFPWAEYHPDGVVGSFEGHFGSDGVGLGMSMLIYWRDLAKALQELLGYSYRSVESGTAKIYRSLPWQHPYANQLYVKAVSSVQGVQMVGIGSYVSPGAASSGSGNPVNVGPGTEYTYARLILSFWRPPYYVRSDVDIEVGGQPQEWLRYFDKNFQVIPQALTRDSGAYRWVPDQGAPTSTITGTVAQKVTRIKLIRRWYEIPEQCLFSPISDTTPNGRPTNLMFTQTEGTNPITGYVLPIGSPITGCVNLPIGGGTVNPSPPPYVIDDDADNQFLGFPMGTLLYEGFEIVPRPLQLPSALMDIPTFRGTEPISQTQYDVIFHFEYFDPPLSPDVNAYYAGHNNMPYSGNGLWYPIQSQYDANGDPTSDYVGPDGPSSGSGLPALTPFHYADFSTLFTVL